MEASMDTLLRVLLYPECMRQTPNACPGLVNNYVMHFFCCFFPGGGGGGGGGVVWLKP